MSAKVPQHSRHFSSHFPHSLGRKILGMGPTSIFCPFSTHFPFYPLFLPQPSNGKVFSWLRFLLNFYFPSIFSAAKQSISNLFWCSYKKLKVRLVGWNGMGMGEKYVWYALWNGNAGNGHSIKWWNLHSIIKPMELAIPSFMN